MLLSIISSPSPKHLHFHLAEKAQGISRLKNIWKYSTFFLINNDKAVENFVPLLFLEKVVTPHSKRISDTFGWNWWYFNQEVGNLNSRLLLKINTFGKLTMLLMIWIKCPCSLWVTSWTEISTQGIFVLQIMYLITEKNGIFPFWLISEIYIF